MTFCQSGLDMITGITGSEAGGGNDLGVVSVFFGANKSNKLSCSTISLLSFGKPPPAREVELHTPGAAGGP